MGMIGTYYFCSAVILSILLSFVVDMFDEWDRQRVEEDLLDRRRELEFVLRGEEEEGCLELTEEVEEPSPLNRTLVLDHSSLHSRSHYSHHRHHQPQFQPRRPRALRGVEQLHCRGVAGERGD